MTRRIASVRLGIAQRVARHGWPRRPARLARSRSARHVAFKRAACSNGDRTRGDCASASSRLLPRRQTLVGRAWLRVFVNKKGAPKGAQFARVYSVLIAIKTAITFCPFNGPKRGVTRITRPSSVANVNLTPSSLPNAFARSRSIEGLKATCACGKLPPSGITCFQLGKRLVVPSRGRR